VEEIRNTCELFSGNLKGNDYFHHLDVVSRIILKREFEETGPKHIDQIGQNRDKTRAPVNIEMSRRL
jgi:hypothetical protein